MNITNSLLTSSLVPLRSAVGTVAPLSDRYLGVPGRSFEVQGGVLAGAEADGETGGHREWKKCHCGGARQGQAEVGCIYILMT